MYLGIDIGTSSVKTVLFDRDQRLDRPGEPAADRPAPAPRLVRAGPRGLVGTPSRRPSTPSPRDHGLADLRGIGLSGQMHGAVCLDHDDRVLRPAILWNDGRAMAECAELEAAFPRAREVAGNIAMPGFTAPKLALAAQARARDLRPHRHRAAAQGLHPLPPDRPPRLGDVRRLRHPLARRRRPRLVRRPARGDRPHPRPHAAPRRGQRRPPATSSPTSPPAGASRGTVVVAGGAGDNAAAACGVGVVTPGSAFVSIGTSGVLFVSNARFSPNTDGAVHAFCHAIPDTWHQMGVILSASDSLEWLARIAGTQARRPRRRGRPRRPRPPSPSSPTSPASARRTTTPPPAAPSSASPSRHGLRRPRPRR